MTIDNEILLGEQEKHFKKAENILLEEMELDGFLNKENLDEADKLNLKYSKSAEMLREFDYNTFCNNMIKAGIFTLEEANKIAYITGADPESILNSKKVFGENVAKVKALYEAALDDTNNGDIKGYNKMARIFTALSE